MTVTETVMRYAAARRGTGRDGFKVPSVLLNVSVVIVITYVFVVKSSQVNLFFFIKLL